MSGNKAEEVRHGDVTTGVKCVITTSIAICSLPLFFVACTGTGPWGALKVHSSYLNTKASRGQVHSLSEGPTWGHSVRLTCRLMQ